MKTNLYEELFNFSVKKNLKIACTNNEIYNQLLLYIFSAEKRDLLILTAKLNDANKLFFNLKNYYEETYIFPDDDYLTKKAVASSPDLLYMRMNLLNNIASGESKIVICPVNSFMKKLPNLNNFKNLSIKVSNSSIINRNEFINNLVEIGYKKETTVTNTGEFAVRGFVIDVFAIYEDHPIRIEFFDDSVEKIKFFDEYTQLSLKEVDNIEIKPIKDDYINSTSNILEYLNNPLTIIEDEEKINEKVKIIKEQAKYYDDFEDYDFDSKKITNKISIDLLDNLSNYDYTFFAQEIPNYYEKSDQFIEDIIKNDGILYSNNEKYNSFIKVKNIKVETKPLNNGFLYNEKYYYSINNLKRPNENNFYNLKYNLGKRITTVDNLTVGDYVVHKSYGIGIYRGITTIKKNGIEKDYILLQYKGTDKLYIPVDKLEKIYKYSSKDGAKPILQKLNTNEWEKIKKRIKEKVKEVAAELIKIYKQRSNSSVEPFEKDYDIQRIFEDSFEYEETADQLKAIVDIKKDLESSKPMDRLLCGDVGFGKTEVIFRAIFKTILNNKQVMYLCPTTLLSQQQYENAMKRFKDFGVNIEILNRYTTKAKARKVLELFYNGKIDLLFGTHRLLSDDVKPNNLGLLVIDEEQRFGVIHKEKIKKYKANVHILSVSATPIPRSLQMSLTGIRDLSLIETPPKNRYPIQTYVIAYDELLLKEAVEKEVSRNGQVFVLYNKIKNMDALMIKMRQLLPNISFECAHGKMQKEQIQAIMTDFYENKFNVLISTTIIENGIDIPNANTMIVINSELFGLSQLYQIRGRVGRSDRIAYTYFMYNKNNMLTENASKRLNAIKEFTQLGNGYKIAMRDLSIRGAGDMLGTEQAGFIDTVGVDLYLELVSEELNGKNENEENEEVLIDEVSTHINKQYTEEDELIIELHNKINSIKTEEELKNLEKEIIDRFGFIDEKIKNYMLQEYAESLLKKLSIQILLNDKNKMTLKLTENVFSKLNLEELFVKATEINNKFSFVYRKNSIIVSLIKIPFEKHFISYILELLKYIEKKL